MNDKNTTVLQENEGVQYIPFVFRYTAEMDKPYVEWAKKRMAELQAACHNISASRRVY